MSNRYLRTSVVDVKFVYQNNDTVLKDFFFTSPFKIVKPLKSDNNFTRVMIMSSSGGIMAGDNQKMTIDIGDNCRAETVSQSYEKIHKMDEGQAIRTCDIKVGKNAIYNFMPQPTIPYANSAFENITNIELADETSKLVYHEVLSAGRIAHGEKFGYKFFKTLTNIYEKGELIYRDNCVFDPSMFEMNGFGMYEGYTHLSNQVICNFGEGKVVCDTVRQVLSECKEDITYGVSVTQSDDVVIRVLGFEGNALEMINAKILKALIELDNK